MTDLVTVAVPGLPTAGPITGNELVAVHQNGRLVKARQGDITGGGAAFLDRVAAVAMTAGTVVVSAGVQMAPADPFNEGHRGLVLGILTGDVARGVLGRVQSLGLMTGVAVPVSAGSDALFVGAGGALARTAPAGAAWQQIVARSDAATAIVIALGEASLVYTEYDALLTEGGFSMPCGLDQAADPNAAGQYVTPAANARALAGKANLGHTAVNDANYQCLPTDVQVGMVALTAPRTVWLPDIDTYPFQELVIADESGACSPTLPITILPGPDTGDILDGAPILLEDTRRGLRFRRGAANSWIRM